MKIVVPLLAPTLVNAWLWIALLTFRELTLAVLLNRDEQQPQRAVGGREALHGKQCDEQRADAEDDVRHRMRQEGDEIEPAAAREAASAAPPRRSTTASARVHVGVSTIRIQRVE